MLANNNEGYYMKKITFFLTTVFFTALNLSSAKADSYSYTPYFGIDYTYNHTTAKGFSPYYNVAGLHIGSDYGKYFGTELFFNKSNGNKRHISDTAVKTSYNSYGLDLMGYIPLGCSKRFSLLGTVGVGEYVYRTKFIPQKHQNEHGYGYRFGSGFKYALSKNFGVRTIIRYVNFDRLNGYNNAFEYSAGIEYHF